MNDKQRIRNNRQNRVIAYRKRLFTWELSKDGSPTPPFCIECAYVKCKCGDPSTEK